MKNKRREEAYGLGKNFLLKKKKKEFPPWFRSLHSSLGLLYQILLEQDEEYMCEDSGQRGDRTEINSLAFFF